MKQSLQIIEHALADAKSPVVLSSFSKDSLLLTWMVRQVNSDVPVLWFRDKINLFAENVIKGWDLTVLSYQPADRYLVPSENGFMLVDEYSVGDARLPVLRDVTVNCHCDLESLSPLRTPTFSYPFDVTLFGFKAADASNHFVTRNTVLPMSFNLGHTRMVSPLIHWTDAQVLQALTDLNIPYEPYDDSVAICANCNDQLANWDGTSSLQAFRTRFGFNL